MILLGFDVNIGDEVFFFYVFHGVVFSGRTFGRWLSMEFEVDNLGYLCKIRPSIGFLFGEDELGLKSKLKGANGGKGDILIGFGVEILIFCGFNGDKLIWNDIPLYKNIMSKLLLKIVFN